MKYQLILFDLDGTAFDTSDGIWRTSSAVCRKMGYEPLPESEKHKIIGPPLRECFMIIGMTADDAEKAEKLYIESFPDIGKLAGVPYEGFGEMLEALTSAGLKLAVATLKNDAFVLPIFEKHGFEKHFTVLQGSIRHKGILTKDLIIAECLKKCAIDDPSTVLMVGDSPYDAEGAERCGCDFAAVTFGFGFPTRADAENTKHVFIADSNKELCDFILHA